MVVSHATSFVTLCGTSFQSGGKLVTPVLTFFTWLRYRAEIDKERYWRYNFRGVQSYKVSHMNVLVPLVPDYFLFYYLQPLSSRYRGLSEFDGLHCP